MLDGSTRNLVLRRSAAEGRPTNQVLQVTREVEQSNLLVGGKQRHRLGAFVHPSGKHESRTQAEHRPKTVSQLGPERGASTH